mmetsp:Transcript_8742/g.9098  ORF Transcript_8742/g.9098 Transcript_8742/m.9098 type:complete len:297 (+) Transcript_8742:74-964(+)
MEKGDYHNNYYSNSKQTDFQEKLDQVNSELRDQWSTEQLRIQALRQNSNPDKNFLLNMRYIAGLDLSFSKKDKNKGYAGIVIVDIKNNNKTVYEKYIKVEITQPYIPSFLAFREIDHYKKLLNEIKDSKDPKVKQYYPHVILLDGNGIIHPRGCGIAVHLGVEMGVPTIGCAKTVYAIDEISVKSVAKLSEKLGKVGQYIKLKGKSGKVWGAAVMTYYQENFDYEYHYYNYPDYPTPNDPIIVSEGHLIDLDTAIDVVLKFSGLNSERTPYPIYLADKFSRKKVFNDDKNSYKSNK